MIWTPVHCRNLGKVIGLNNHREFMAASWVLKGAWFHRKHDLRPDEQTSCCAGHFAFRVLAAFCFTMLYHAVPILRCQHQILALLLRLSRGHWFGQAFIQYSWYCKAACGEYLWTIFGPVPCAFFHYSKGQWTKLTVSSRQWAHHAKLVNLLEGSKQRLFSKPGAGINSKLICVQQVSLNFKL